MFDVNLGNSMLLDGLYVHLIYTALHNNIHTIVPYYHECMLLQLRYTCSRYHLFMFNMESITALVIIGFALM